MAQSFKAPPQWQSQQAFESWKSEVELWTALTDLEKGKQGPAVALSLTDYRREVALQVPHEEIKAEDGLQKVLAKLEASFGKETNDKVYEAYEQFEKVNRKNLVMSEYIMLFERCYSDLEKNGIKLPDVVLACKLVHAANLDVKERHLVLAGVQKLEYRLVKSTLRRIYSSSVVESSEADIKIEPAFSAVESSEGNSDSAFFSSKYKSSRGRGYRGQKRGYSSNRGTNPLDRTGRVSTCRNCGSRFHWARECPNRDESSDHPPAVKKPEKEDSEEDVYLTLASSCRNLLNQCTEKAIFDSACTKSVAGSLWFADFTRRLPPELQKQVVKRPTTTKIMFGDGRKTKCLFQAKIPVEFGHLSCYLDCQIVQGDLPLLLSVKSMSKAQLDINFGDNSFTVAGETAVKHQGEILSTGHIAINVIPSTPPSKEEIVLMTLGSSEISKLHKQFGHCRSDKLLNLLKDAGHDAKLLGKQVQDAVDNCSTCVRYGRTAGRPKISAPLGLRFNETLAIDLHQMTTLDTKCWFLHIIDVYTRFSVATLIYNKKPETVAEKLLTKWVFVFGIPDKIMSDNGGEFCNQHIQSLMEYLGVSHLTTAAESPFSNGVCERHNLVLTETFEKVKSEHVSLDPEVILQHATFAKNSLHNRDGFSPY